MEKFQFNKLDWGEQINTLIDNKDITDILVRNNEVWVTSIKKGHYKTNVKEDEIQEVLALLPGQIANRMSTTFNTGNPILDGDGNELRFNAIHSSLTYGEFNAIAIRKTPVSLNINKSYMLKTNYCTEECLNLLEVLVDSQCNIIVGGMTGSGKTELLKYMARWIRNTENIITIEDTFEAHLKKIYPDLNALGLKVNANNSHSDLLKACLRQDPSRIFVSEARGKEILDMLSSISTGHSILTTIHTSSAIDIPSRMLAMIGLDSENTNSLYQIIYNLIDIGIYIHYDIDKNGSVRRVAEIAEFDYDHELNKPLVNIIYEYDFAKDEVIFNKIKSKKILKKMAKRKTNTDHIKEIFL